ncbi:MAG TPA: hypothetical protein PK453_13865 [Leptospiraceae bacterium]|nr:hypothetical protein [Leptospiraceae bacterium]HNF14751.1 hypothetical protein [Leptospiraceae bacterium]HNI95046.1 hypothetical protein [Leptospiraceae bacterium]HNM02878.1 hypothetical protein [Leptospiraceae bacterium]
MAGTSNSNSQEKKAGSNKSVILKTPQSLTMFSATAKCILDELRERHKTLDKHGSKKPHPSEFLTLDKLQEALVKYTNLSEQGRAPEAVDTALRTLLDIDARGNQGKERYIYLYPFLLKSANKITAKIAIIAPQSIHELDVKHYREACFEYSQSMVDLILSNRAKKSKEIDENDPGNSLFQKNKNGQDWLFPNRFSIENEIALLIKSAFKPYGYIPLNDFTEDFIDYGNAAKSLDQITPKYHMILDEIQLKEDGTYVRQPEMVIHYRAQADGLEKFVLKYLPKLAEEAGASEFKTKLGRYTSEHLEKSEPGRKQSREKTKVLIALLKEFPMSKLNSETGKNFKTTCEESIQILEKMIFNMDNLIGRKYNTIQKNLGGSLINYISDYTKNNLKLMVLDVEAEIERSGIKDPEKIKEVRATILKEVKEHYPTRETQDDDGNKIIFVVDQGYMAGVLHKYSSSIKTLPNLSKEFDIAKLMNQEMVQTNNPRLNVNLRKDLVESLNKEAFKNEEQERERNKSEFFKTKFNFLAGGGVFLVCLIISAYFYSAESDIVYMLFGVPISLLFGYLAAVMIKKRPMSGTVTNRDKSFKSVIAESEETNDEKTSQIAKAAAKHIYPSTYNKISDKIYNSESLKEKISETFADIKASVPILAKEQDISKVASSIEHAVLNSSIIIAIPPEIVPLGMPAQVIVSKADFKSPLLRSQLSEHYRAEAEKVKLDKALLKYYTFLINTVELEYYKFLNKKIR